MIETLAAIRCEEITKEETGREENIDDLAQALNAFIKMDDDYQDRVRSQAEATTEVLQDSVGQKPLKLKQGLDSVSCFNTEPDSRFRFNCFESVLKHGVYSPPASSFIITSSSSSMLASSYMSSSLSNASCSAPWSGMEFIVKSSARLTVPSRSSS